MEQLGGEKISLAVDFQIFKFRRRRFQSIIMLGVMFFFFALKILLQYCSVEDTRCDGHLKSKVNGILDKEAPIFMTVICNGEEAQEAKNLKASINRQIEQAITMLKSAAVLAISYINFIIVVDHDSLFDVLIEEIERWPEDIKDKLCLEKRTVWFPEGIEFRNFYRECSCAPLFFVEYLTDIESTIYVDTDMLFMRPPEDLWREFQYFDSKQMCGIAPIDGHYVPTLKIPYYGERGLNTGLWMMNLTRMRNFPGGWVKTCQDSFQEHRENLVYHDQDIANIIFNKNPKYLYAMGCHWNFRTFLCNNGVNICEESIRKGAFLLHGNGLAYFYKNDLKLKAMYEVWKNFQPGQPLSDLLSTLKKFLGKVDETSSSRGCRRIDGIDRILTKGLEDHIQSLT